VEKSPHPAQREYKTGAQFCIDKWPSPGKGIKFCAFEGQNLAY